MVFEPYTTDAAIADIQAAEIDVSVGDVVSPGDVLGRLVVPGTIFPHIHWGMYITEAGTRTPVCPRDYVTPEAATELDALYIDRLGLNPVCYDVPTIP